MFVWGKKLQKEGLTDLKPSEIKSRTKQKQVESRVELDKVRQRRLQYERERAEREEEVQMVQREKEAAHFRMWEEQEDVFHLKQAQLRSEIRIRDGRAKPVDLLAKYISSQSEDLNVDIHEPYTYIEGLGKKELEDLLEDISVYQVRIADTYKRCALLQFPTASFLQGLVYSIVTARVANVSADKSFFLRFRNWRKTQTQSTGRISLQSSTRRSKKFSATKPKWNVALVDKE